MEKKKIVIIGGGAAGISAAIFLMREGFSVTVIEHTDAPLKKLLLTGNGRCNFTNTDVNVSHYHGDVEIAKKVLECFSVDDCLDFLESIGVEPLEMHYSFDKRGYFYPSTNSSKTVFDALMVAFNTLGGTLVLNTTPLSIDINDHVLRTDNGDFSFDKLIFACGSNAYPKTGSDSSIYKMLMSLGVDFKTFLPALTAVKSDDERLKDLKGIRALCSVFVQDNDGYKVFKAEDGEVQFNEHYVSGIPVMQLSRYASKFKKEGHNTELLIRIHKWTNKEPDCGVRIGETLHLNVTGTAGFDKCQACSGGVTINSIDENTLSLRNNPDIYFAGEMINVDGDCGGYNLHFAFASAYRAALSIKNDKN
ncbi:MAG: NAD(P)/FAD-dependent oxidoreductase [Eubacteriales bacterium]|nr:NAD(P)/FAD-dependent oxidoreductase [Eubacteriales bacterium]